MTLLFHAQYLNQSGSLVRTEVIFADSLATAYDFALARARLPVDPIQAAWVTIQEDPYMFEKFPSPDPAILKDAWASPFKPVPVVPIPPLELDVNGRIAPPSVAQ